MIDDVLAVLQDMGGQFGIAAPKGFGIAAAEVDEELLVGDGA